MRTVQILALLVVAACGGSGAETTAQPASPAPAPARGAPPPAPTAAPPAAAPDRAARCATFVERSRPVMQQMAGSAGKSFTPEDEAQLRTTCAEKPGSADEVLIDCVLAAGGEPAVQTCWKDAMQRYIDASKA